MKKLEIGPTPGNKIGPEWDTMDIMPQYNPTYVHDVKKPMTMIPDNTYDVVYASHIIEHIPWYNVQNVLNEFYRITKPNGNLEIWVPDFEKIVQVYISKEFPDNWRMMNPENNPMKWVLGRLFAHDRDGTNDWNFHRAAFDYDTLHSMLSIAKYQNIQKLQKTRTVDHGWVNLGVTGKK